MWWSRRIWINKCTFFRHVAFNFILKSWGFFSVWRVVTGTVTGSVRWICVWLRLYLTEKKSVWEKFYVCIFSAWCECMLPDASKLIDWWCSNEQWMTRKGWNKKVHVVVVGCLEIISLLPPTLRAEDFRRPSAQLFKCLCYFLYFMALNIRNFFFGITLLPTPLSEPIFMLFIFVSQQTILSFSTLTLLVGLCKKRPWNDLLCVLWDVESHLFTVIVRWCLYVKLRVDEMFMPLLA